MPACDFTLTHAGSPQSLFPIARRGIQQQGGTLTGNPRQGQVRFPSPVGQIEGTYTASGNQVRIVITRKPLLAPCGEIQRRLAELLAQVPPEVIDAPAEPEEPPVGPRPEDDVVLDPVFVEPPVEYYTFEDDVITVPRRQQARWPLWIGVGVLTAGGIWLWRSRQA